MFNHAEGAALRIGIVEICPGTDDEFALVRLAKIDVHSVGHEDSVHHRLQWFGDKRL